MRLNVFSFFFFSSFLLKFYFKIIIVTTIVFTDCDAKLLRNSSQCPAQSCPETAFYASAAVEAARPAM